MTAVLGRGVATAPDRPVLDRPVLDRPVDPGPADPGPARGRLRRMWILPALVVVAGALALLPGVGDGGPGPGEAEVRVDGVATVVRADGEAQVVADRSVRIGPGDLIEVTAGRARFALDQDVAFEGRSGPAVAGRAGTTVRMGAVPELVAGPLLVVAPVPVVVRAAGSDVTVGPVADDGNDAAGAARLDRRLGLGIGTYRGAVEVDSAGQVAPVVSLRRIEVARPGALERRDLPLEYAADDPWDRRFLADALLVDGRLGPLLDAFDAAGGGGPATVEGLRRARPSLPVIGLRELVTTAPTGSAALVTAVLADLGTAGSFRDRVEAVERFRDGGAPWGLVAMDQGVTPDEVLAAVRAAVDRLGPDGISLGAEPDVGAVGDAGGGEDEVAAGAPAAPGASAAGTADGSGPAGPAPDPDPPPGGPAGPGPGTGAPGGPAPSAPAPPVTVPPSLPLPGGDQGLLGGVGDVVEGVGGAVGDVVDDVTSGLEDVVDGLLDIVGRVLVTGGPDGPLAGVIASG